MSRVLRVAFVGCLAAATVAGLTGGLAQEAEAQDYSDHRPVLAYAEIITDPGSGEAGRIVYFRADLGNAQLTSDYVFGDPRRALFNGGSPGVTYAVNSGFPSGDANLTQQLFWLYEAIDTWDRETCADMLLTENAIVPGTPGVVQRFFQTNVINLDWVADLTQVGFLSPGQFPYFAANPNVLGVTFTLTWVDGSGNPTDIDGNGKIDVAFREIYYNDAFSWSDNGGPGIDFPSVAIHEVGHGFSAAHFGLIGVKDGSLVAHPRTVMNAIYGGALRTLTGRDVASHCSNWAQWPNN